MRNELLKHIKGDKFTWAIVVVFTVMSFLAVYSASTNLVYVVGSTSTTANYLFKHAILMAIGFVIIYLVHRTPYRFFRALAGIGLVVSWVLLLLTLLKGNTIEGANASRWIQLPLVGISFQPSTFAMVLLMIYVASYLANNYKVKVEFSQALLRLWLPVFVTVALVVPANLSTAVLLFASAMGLAFVGGHPFRYLVYIVFSGIVMMAFFFLFVKAFPDVMPNRVDTWISRIENFAEGGDSEENYQVARAKMAIAKGGFRGEGPGKSVMKNFLPQSTSDFIYAIIVEEYGSLGALTVLAFYGFLLFRILVISKKAMTLFGQLLVVGVGFPIITQALINMGVAVSLLPVTGQNLPMISSGGTSIWMTCFALGLILSVSVHREENEVGSKAKGDSLEQAQEDLAEEIIGELNKGKVN